MSDNPHVLLIGDDLEIGATVQDYLTSQDYRVSVVRHDTGVRRAIEQSRVDVVLLDLTLHQQDGFVLARSLRAQNPEIGILILTERTDMIDRIIGLEIGADDALVKPVDPRELLARIRSIRRRRVTFNNRPAVQRSQLRFSGWLFDPTARELLSPAGERVVLTPGEFDLLAVFANHPNRVLSRHQLLELLRHREASPFDRTVDVQIGRLRRKLNDDPQQPQLIKTLRGAGYMFTGPVEIVTLSVSGDSPQSC
ncbi:MAG: response regulator transcription factor [Stellaceae bacterium]